MVRPGWNFALANLIETPRRIAWHGSRRIWTCSIFHLPPTIHTHHTRCNYQLPRLASSAIYIYIYTRGKKRRFPPTPFCSCTFHVSIHLSHFFFTMDGAGLIGPRLGSATLSLRVNRDQLCGVLEKGDWSRPALTCT